MPKKLVGSAAGRGDWCDPRGKAVPVISRAVVGSAAVPAARKAAEGGTTGEIVSAGVGGMFGAAGGEAFGQALGMVQHKIYSAFSGAAKAEVQQAAKVLSEQKPKNVLADGTSVENKAYTQAKDLVESRGLDAQHAAYAYDQVKNQATKAEAFTQRPGAIEAAKAGQ